MASRNPVKWLTVCPDEGVTLRNGQLVPWETGSLIRVAPMGGSAINYVYNSELREPWGWQADAANTNCFPEGPVDTSVGAMKMDSDGALCATSMIRDEIDKIPYIPYSSALSSAVTVYHTGAGPINFRMYTVYHDLLGNIIAEYMTPGNNVPSGVPTRLTGLTTMSSPHCSLRVEADSAESVWIWNPSLGYHLPLNASTTPAGGIWGPMVIEHNSERPSANGFGTTLADPGFLIMDPLLQWVPNPLFALGVSGYAAGSCTVAHSEKFSRMGPGSLEMTATGAGASIACTVTPTNLLPYNIKVIVFNPTANSRTVDLRVAGVTVDTMTLAAGEHNELAARLTGNGASKLITIHVTNSLNTEKFYVLYFGVVTAPSVFGSPWQATFDPPVVPYIDSAGTIRSGYAWSGAAHASSSSLDGYGTYAVNDVFKSDYESGTFVARWSAPADVLSGRVTSGIFKVGIDFTMTAADGAGGLKAGFRKDTVDDTIDYDYDSPLAWSGSLGTAGTPEYVFCRFDHNKISIGRFTTSTVSETKVTDRDTWHTFTPGQMSDLAYAFTVGMFVSGDDSDNARFCGPISRIAAFSRYLTDLELKKLAAVRDWSREDGSGDFMIGGFAEWEDLFVTADAPMIDGD